MATTTTRKPRKAIPRKAGKKPSTSRSLKMKTAKEKTKKASAKTSKKVAVKTATRKPATRKIKAKTSLKAASRATTARRNPRRATNEQTTENQALMRESEATLTEQPKMRLSRKNTSKFREMQQVQSTPDNVANPELRK